MYFFFVPRLGSIPIQYASYYSFLVTVSVVLQVICFVLFGAMAGAFLLTSPHFF
jgi:hypothetical protein